MTGFRLDLTNRTQEAKALLRELAGAALEGIAQRAETYAKARCPVDTGRLQGSLTHVREDLTAWVGSPVDYAAYVELGTSKAKAQPYLGPAVYEHTEEYQDMAASALKG